MQIHTDIALVLSSRNNTLAAFWFFSFPVIKYQTHFTTPEKQLFMIKNTVFFTYLLSTSHPIDFWCWDSSKYVFMVASVPRHEFRTSPPSSESFRMIWASTEMGFALFWLLCAARSFLRFKPCRKQSPSMKALRKLSKHFYSNNNQIQTVGWCDSQHYSFPLPLIDRSAKNVLHVLSYWYGAFR